MSENKLTFKTVIILLIISLISLVIPFALLFVTLPSIWYDVIIMVLLLIVSLGIIIFLFVKIRTIITILKENKTPIRIISVILLVVANLVLITFNIFTAIFVIGAGIGDL